MPKNSDSQEKGSDSWFSWTWVILIVLLLIVILLIYLFYFEQVKSAYHKLKSLSEEKNSSEDSLQDSLIDFTSTELEKSRASPPPIKWKREEACRKILEEIYRDKFEKYRPDFLKNNTTGRNLELDGYNPRLKIAFEHNGEQHYNYPNAYHKTEEEFIYQLQKDRFKDRVCRRLHIYLIVIPYTVPWNQLRSYIISKLPREETDSAPEFTEITWTK